MRSTKTTRSLPRWIRPDQRALLYREILLSESGVPGTTFEILEDQDWSETWRRDFHAMQFGSRLWVCPAHESPPDPNAVVVDMDPGLAFGTGTHPTTALCLEWLDGQDCEERSVVDYGCGSGILAIAAAEGTLLLATLASGLARLFRARAAVATGVAVVITGVTGRPARASRLHSLPT